MWDWIDKYIGEAFRFMDRHYLSRRAALYLTIYQTWDSYTWAKTYINTHADKSGVELAATVGALLACVTALQGLVLKLYADAKAEG